MVGGGVVFAVGDEGLMVSVGGEVSFAKEEDAGSLAQEVDAVGDEDCCSGPGLGAVEDGFVDEGLAFGLY